jgi:hypothetical protein
LAPSSANSVEFDIALFSLRLLDILYCFIGEVVSLSTHAAQANKLYSFIGRHTQLQPVRVIEIAIFLNI